jgi:[ribosomal protein S18]-alanine N-acetyltransferase
MSATPAPVVDRIQEADVEHVAAIDAASFPASRGASQADAISQLREELSRPWSRVWVVRGATGEALGFVLLWHIADEIHLLNLATHTAYRRRGLARALLEHVLEEARTAAVRHVLLEVRRSNLSAIALYRGFGFRAVAIRDRYYADDEDAIEMALSLDPSTQTAVSAADDVRID